MAQIATLSEVYPIAGIETVPPIPVGALADVATVIGLDLVDAITIKNRFPTPPSAVAFLTDVLEENDAGIDNPLAYDSLTAPYTITGAVYPESSYLEPTKGQIWPRIG